MDLNEAIDTLVAESRGLLSEMESALMNLEADPLDSEAINAVFRAAHTIKGSAGLFGFDVIVDFTHHLETLLVHVRQGSVALTEPLVGLLLRSGDHIGRLIDALESGSLSDISLDQAGTELVREILGADGAVPSHDGAVLARPDESMSGIGVEVPSDRVPDGDLWHLSLRFSKGVLQEGFDPASFIHHLKTIGRVVGISTVTQGLPILSDLDPELCYLGFEIRLQSNANKADIEAVFEFVQQDCELRILPPNSKVEDYLALIDELPAERLRLGEILVACGAITEQELQRALQEQDAPHAEHLPLGEILIEEHTVQAELVSGAIQKQSEQRQRQSVDAKLVRVQSEKLDALIDHVAELIISSSAVGAMAGRNRDRALREAISKMSRLTESVRDGAMRLRMVEIGDTFSRFRRLVRDVSKELGKEIDFHVAGGDTELDRSLVDRIGDPLTHLVRNAIDHGIESADVRLQRGKPGAGRLDLRARHEAGAIVIEVQDDGGGLNRSRIISKAVQCGLIESGDGLSDQEVWSLIFEPGFSTAEKVSSISGRGVGMDVVKKSIEALRGTVEIESRPEAGSVFRIRLPLTLAIIDGFLMAVGQAHYVVPLEAVLECVQLPAGVSGYLDLRGEVLPLLRLREQFGVASQMAKRENVVVVQVAGKKVGLVVDQLKGEFQAVLKPLGPLMDGLPGLSGSTILGTGEVALMLDLPSLVKQVGQHRTQGDAAPLAQPN